MNTADLRALLARATETFDAYQLINEGDRSEQAAEVGCAAFAAQRELEAAAVNALPRLLAAAELMGEVAEWECEAVEEQLVRGHPFPHQRCPEFREPGAWCVVCRARAWVESQCRE